MIKPHIQIRGISASIVALDKMKDIDSIRIADGLSQYGDLILSKSHELVPKDTLALDKSGRKDVEGSGFFAIVTVSYGGPTAPYAFIVHYDMTKYHEPPTQDHYLSDAIRLTKAAGEALLNRTMRANTFEGTRAVRSETSHRVESI